MKTVTNLLFCALLITGCASMKKDCCDSDQSCKKNPHAAKVQTAKMDHVLSRKKIKVNSVL